MSQDFKLKFDRLRENNPTHNEQQRTKDHSSEETTYPSYSNTRNLSFLWTDGRRLFLNYAYLISGEYLPNKGVIALGFTTHTIIIKGNHLDTLFEQLMSQMAKLIVCTDERYMSLGEDTPIVYEIKVEQ